jgi:hypothetical protein
MTTQRPDSALERLLVALEDELLQATDEEVLAAAHELGMNPAMKGSSAFIGVTMLVRPMTTRRRTRSYLKKTDEHHAGGPRRRPKGDTPG